MRRGDQGSAHRPDVQGLRAVAVLMVVGYHAGGLMPGGFSGVDVFFVISGFVITRMLQREISSTGRVDWLLFYTRRARRLLPTLALVLVATAVGSALVLSPYGTQQQTGRTGLYAILMTANLKTWRSMGGYFGSSAEANPLLHTWSLGVEEQFYLAFPALLLWSLRPGRRPWSRQWVPTAVLGCVSLGLAFALTSGSWTPPGLHEPAAFAFFSPFTRAWEFAAGCLVALVREVGRSQAPLRAAQWTGVAAVVTGGWFISGETSYPGPGTLIPVVGTALALVGGSAPGGRLNRLLASAPLEWFGDRSYSWYLWHWPTLVMAQAAWPGSEAGVLGAVAVSLVLTSVTYSALEDPMRHNGRLLRRGALRLVVPALLLPLLVCQVLYLGAERQWGDTSKQAFKAAIDASHLDVIHHCDSGEGPRILADCTWGRDLTGSPVYLLGDSQAGALSEGVVRAATSAGRPVSVWTTSDCPFADLTMETGSRSAATCDRERQAVLALLRSAKPGRVLVAISDHYITEDRFAWPGLRDGESLQERTSQFVAAMQRIDHQIRQSGHTVVWIASLPHFNGAHVVPSTGYAPDRCAGGLLFDVAACSARMPPRADQTAIASAEAQFLRVVSLTSSLCPGAQCSSVIQGRPVYRDATHITVDRSAALAGELAQALEPDEMP